MIDRRQSIIDNIFKRIKVVDLSYSEDSIASPCFIWQGPNSGSGRGGGYPRMCLGSQTVAVHLVVYTHYFGYIPSKKQVDHKCNNRLCCNPSHLDLVTHLTNQRRRAARTKGKT